MRRGPTASILEFARQQPGGVIRWSEAETIYLRESSSARMSRSVSPLAARSYWRRHRSAGFHQNLGRLFKRYFVKVERARGFYVLKQTIFNDELPGETEVDLGIS